MSMEIKTIKIVHGDDYCIINECDFDPKTQKVFGGVKAPVQEPKADESEAIELGTDSGDQLSDKQLRDVIKDLTGDAPAGRCSRETLVNKYNELNAQTSAE